jgi:predicted metal-dependent peptidase
MIINQELSNIPTDAIKLTDGYPAHEPAEVYYDRLLKEQKQNQKQGNGSGNGEGNPKTSDRNDPGNNSGKTGTGKQDHSGGIPKQWDSVMDAPVLGENDVESMTDDILRETIKERLNAGDSAEKLRGLHAGALADYVDDLTKPPIINWKHAITRFVTSLSDSHTRNTLKKPDRRNLTPYGKKKEYLPALIICIDTSGSVSNELLAEFFSQIVYLGRIVSEIDIIIADAEVHDHFVYKKGMEPQLKKRGYGRGGTDFDPAVQYINRNLRDKDGAIYLTDGYCPVPTTKCALPMIWVVTDNETFEGRPRIMAKTKESNR